MKIWMSAGEETAFRAFLAPAQNYFEYGCGGSTVAAASVVPGKIVSVDSAPEWLDKVRAALPAGAADRVTLRHADIGPLRDAGYPTDESRRAEWPRYHAEVWEHERAEAFDLFLIDGRFRVACFAQAISRCRADAVILFHDYANRANYHAVAAIGREVFRLETLSAFVRPADFKPDLARDVLHRYRDAAG